MKPRAFAALVLAVSILVACGSGGGGGSGGGNGVIPTQPGATSTPTALPSGGATNTPAPSTTNTPAPGTTNTPAPGTTNTPAPGTTNTPAPGTTSTPAPSASSTPSPTPTGYFAQGNVSDFDTKTPIGGATVVIAPPVYAGATPPPGVTTSATTASDGSFTITNLIPGSNYIEVFNAGFATLHKKFNITSFDNQVGMLNLTRLTADQESWLQRVNSDRATWGAQPVVLDEILVEGARHWASYMATNGWYQSYCPSSDPSCQNALAYEQSQGGNYTSTGSNIDAEQPPSTWQTAEQRFMSESSKCPQPVVPSKCAAAGTAEFLNIVNPNFIWAGLGEAPGGKSYTLLYPFVDYYDQEFGTPLH